MRMILGRERGTTLFLAPSRYETATGYALTWK